MEESNTETCMQDSEQRTLELQEALKQIYTVVKVYEVWDYNKTQKYDPEPTHTDISQNISQNVIN